MTHINKISDFRYNFNNVVSFDNGETVQDVTVAFDYYPAEINFPHDRDSAEVYEVFIFDAEGKDITFDVPTDEFARLSEETKQEHQRLIKEANEV
jgi:hypothetical protein